jgi:hypothetical protein
MQKGQDSVLGLISMMVDFQLSYSNDAILISNDLDTLDVSKASAGLWIAARNYNAIKYKNYKTQVKLVSLVYDAYKKLPDVSGRIMPNEAQCRVHKEDKVVEFRIGAPIPWLMKLAPEGHFIHDWRYPDLYKNCEADDNLVANVKDLYLKGACTKYTHSNQNVTYDFEYILFAHQSLGKVHYYHNLITGRQLLHEVKAWALENKKHVIFRMHPTSEEDYSDLNDLSSAYTHVNTTSSIVDLVTNANQVWTVSSAVGFEGVIMGKPVTIFGEADYRPVVNCAKSVDEAFKPYDSVAYCQFITWYVRNLCINIYSKSAEERVYQRLYDYFVEEKSIDLLY